MLTLLKLIAGAGVLAAVGVMTVLFYDYWPILVMALTAKYCVEVIRGEMMLRAEGGETFKFLTGFMAFVERAYHGLAVPYQSVSGMRRNTFRRAGAHPRQLLLGHFQISR